MLACIIMFFSSSYVTLNPAPAHMPPMDTQLPNVPTNQSSDFQATRTTSNRTHRVSDKKHADDAELSLEGTPILMSRKLTHERNFSDGGSVGKGVTMATKEKVHRRNLSDSTAMASDNISMGTHTRPKSHWRIEAG